VSRSTLPGRVTGSLEDKSRDDRRLVNQTCTLPALVRLVVPSLSLFTKLRHSLRQGSLVWPTCLFSCFMATFLQFALRNTIRLVIYET